MATEKKNWLSLAIARTKQSDEDKLSSFQGYAVKAYQKSIRNYKTQLSTLKATYADDKERDEEILKELREDLITASFALDVKKIETRQSREDFFGDFDNNLSSAFSNVSNKEKAIVEKAKTFDEKVENLERAIKMLEAKCAMLA